VLIRAAKPYLTVLVQLNLLGFFTMMIGIQFIEGGSSLHFLRGAWDATYWGYGSSSDIDEQVPGKVNGLSCGSMATRWVGRVK
jgi:hypothetical protein